MNTHVWGGPFNGRQCPSRACVHACHRPLRANDLVSAGDLKGAEKSVLGETNSVSPTRRTENTCGIFPGQRHHGLWGLRLARRTPNLIMNVASNEMALLRWMSVAGANEAGPMLFRVLIASREKPFCGRSSRALVPQKATIARVIGVGPSQPFPFFPTKPSAAGTRSRASTANCLRRTSRPEIKTGGAQGVRRDYRIGFLSIHHPLPIERGR